MLDLMFKCLLLFFCSFEFSYVENGGGTSIKMSFNINQTMECFTGFCNIALLKGIMFNLIFNKSFDHFFTYVHIFRMSDIYKTLFTYKLFFRIFQHLAESVIGFDKHVIFANNYYPNQ